MTDSDFVPFEYSIDRRTKTKRTSSVLQKDSFTRRLPFRVTSSRTATDSDFVPFECSIHRPTKTKRTSVLQNDSFTKRLPFRVTSSRTATDLDFVPFECSIDRRTKTKRTSLLQKDYFARRLPFRVTSSRTLDELQIDWQIVVTEDDLSALAPRIFDGLLDSEIFFHTLATVALDDMLHTDSPYVVIAVLSCIYGRIKPLVMTRIPACISTGFGLMLKINEALEKTTGKRVLSQECNKQILDHYIVFKHTLGKVTGEHFINVMRTTNAVLRCFKKYVNVYHIQKRQRKKIMDVMRMKMDFTESSHAQDALIIRTFQPQDTSSESVTHESTVLEGVDDQRNSKRSPSVQGECKLPLIEPFERSSKSGYEINGFQDLLRIYRSLRSSTFFDVLCEPESGQIA